MHFVGENLDDLIVGDFMNGLLLNSSDHKSQYMNVSEIVFIKWCKVQCRFFNI